MTNKNYQISEPYAGWLDEFVTTHEASKITGVPTESLSTLRSRGGGPVFVRPKNTRLVRYSRRCLYEWLLSSGLLASTADDRQNPGILTADNDNEEGK
jgi:hypothetical protein